MAFAHTIGGTCYTFATLRELLARATPARSGNTQAAARLAWTIAEARRLQLTGVGLKPAPPQLAGGTHA